MADYNKEPALDALIEILAKENKAVYVKRTPQGKRYLHFTYTIFVDGKQKEVNTIVTDATEETADVKSIRVYQPENHEKNVLSTVGRFLATNAKRIDALEE